MSGFDFRCVWEALGLDNLPFPLAYRIRDKQYMAEVEADRKAALARQRAEMNRNRVRILEALRFPAFMLQGFGRVAHGDRLPLYRLFAVIGTNGYCAVITQDPSEQTIFGEDVQIIGCVNTDFPQVVIEALPDYKPGSKQRRDENLEDQTPAGALRDSRVVESILLSGSADFSMDYELRNPNHLTLINVADDGAYIVNESSQSFQIIPATVRNLLDAFKKVEELQLRAAQRLAAATTNRDFDGIS